MRSLKASLKPDIKSYTSGASLSTEPIYYKSHQSRHVPNLQSFEMQHTTNSSTSDNIQKDLKTISECSHTDASYKADAPLEFADNANGGDTLPLWVNE